MSDLVIHAGSSLPLPLPSVPITIRPGVMSDVPFLDSLQKLHSKQVGWMPTKQFEGKIALGHVLIAEIGGRVSSPAAAAGDSRPPEPVGYCIGNDQYFKRDDVGIIYQLNVLPGKQRSFVGAALLKAMFERSAYGCRLFCCWCAQDIAANRFWEAMGFVPLAFRAGSEKKGRVHIFWQKRIREGDTTTPWWFPSKTNSGSIREDRIVLPIPPGTHWNDAKPLILPNRPERQSKDCQLPIGHDAPAKASPAPINRQPQQQPPQRSGLWFGSPKQEAAPKPKREKKPKAKADPKLVAAARELRDRWLEQVNSGPALLPMGKYDVTRAIAPPPQPSPGIPGEGVRTLLPAA